MFLSPHEILAEHDAAFQLLGHRVGDNGPGQ
jgi:hypothetical protein